MSVYKSRRKDAVAQFIADARELRKYTVRVTRKFPKSYRDITNGLLELAREVYVNAIKGNAIYLHKDMSEHDYELRHRYLMIACSSADAICGEITFCYELVDAGNNFFAGKAEYEKAFQTWTTLANNALNMNFAPASAELFLYLSNATRHAIGTEASSRPMKNMRKCPALIMKYIPRSVERVST